MTQQIDTIVVGGGAMGSAAAWQLAQRGREVTVLERFEGPSHKLGASHGRSRNFNVGYTDPVYAAMVIEARRWWRQLESESGSEILSLVGLVNHGPGIAEDTPEVLVSLGIDATMLTPDEAHERWPGIRFDTRALFMPGGGRVNAEAAVTALQSETVRLGGTVLHNSPVISIRILDDGRAEVVTETETYLANTVVTTVGAWTEKLLGGIVPMPKLVVTQEQPLHFAQLDEAMPWPSFSHAHDPSDPKYDYFYTGIYGMQTPGEGIKAGWHGVGPVTDPDARTFVPEPVQLEALRQYARDWLPGVDPDQYVDISCTYTTSPEGDFILDRFGPIVVGAGFSGHGFKFTPTVGRILADLVDGTSRADAKFALAR
jgi:sarcosine oxidase